MTPGTDRGRRQPLGDTPPQHWTAARKADLLEYLRKGQITREEALQRYDLSEEELASMEARHERFGLAGLKAKKVQVLR